MPRRKVQKRVKHTEEEAKFIRECYLQDPHHENTLELIADYLYDVGVMFEESPQLNDDAALKMFKRYYDESLCGEDQGHYVGSCYYTVESLGNAIETGSLVLQCRAIGWDIEMSQKEMATMVHDELKKHGIVASYCDELDANGILSINTGISMEIPAKLKYANNGQVKLHCSSYISFERRQLMNDNDIARKVRTELKQHDFQVGGSVNDSKVMLNVASMIEFQNDRKRKNEKYCANAANNTHEVAKRQKVVTATLAPPEQTLEI